MLENLPTTLKVVVGVAVLVPIGAFITWFVMLRNEMKAPGRRDDYRKDQ
tara:strand:- start:9 stop:155 length:147 start_codon:yes stop_codon:yes gene_type:complete